jgi:hypothetical protein
LYARSHRFSALTAASAHRLSCSALLERLCLRLYPRDPRPRPGHHRRLP